jgi:hypothetical protein
MKPEPRLYIQREEGEAGPYDLVQMAGLLRRKIITGETMTRVEGEDGWTPFSWQPQFSVVREMPADAISTRIDELDEEAADRDKPPIPLPSRETLIKLAGMLAGGGLAFLGAFALARLDATTGWCLLVAGVSATIVAQCLITIRLLDENAGTLAFIFFVPFGEAYYFICNFWQYFKLTCWKYGGAALAAGAALGLGRHL